MFHQRRHAFAIVQLLLFLAIGTIVESIAIKEFHSAMENQVIPSMSTQLLVNMTGTPGTETIHGIMGTWPTTTESLKSRTGAVCAGFTVDGGCYSNRSSSLTLDSCKNINGYFDHFCYYDSPLMCEYYFRNDQCYSNRSTTLTSSSCLNINGFYTEEVSSSSSSIDYCYYSSFNCVQSTSPDGQCFANISTVFTARTCDVIGGFYDTGSSACYFDAFVCPSSGYQLNSQCYTRLSHRIYTRDSCDVIEGYYDETDGDCFYSGYCDAFAVNDQCYRSLTSQFNCDSCRLVDGFVDASGDCFHTRNCSHYSTSNGQCYRDRSTVIDAESCTSLGGENAFYSSTDARCFYTPTTCADGQYSINCGCFTNRSRNFTADTCDTFNGSSYSHGICYYNSSRCDYFEFDGQCYRFVTRSFTPTTCRNVLGEYLPSTGDCYYSTFDCRGSVGNGQCYSNRSAAMRRSTCQNIGGFYDYPDCLFETFKCSGYSIEGQCQLFKSTSLTCDTCNNIDGLCVYGNGSSSVCYYTSTRCELLEVNGQCYSLSSLTMSCQTCRLIDGYYFSNSRISTMQDCHYLKQGECYTNRTDVQSSSCDQNNTRHYIDSLHCYFNPDDDLAASSCPPQHYYRQCVCYTDKSPTMTVKTCDNINGYWMNTESMCYYTNLTCSGYWADGQCFSQASTGFTIGTCRNLKGFFVSSSSESTLQAGVCYHQSFDCAENQAIDGGWHDFQCYTGCSKELTCETCANIGGLVVNHYGCCYYSPNCTAPNFSANGQCYSNRVCSEFLPSSRQCPDTISDGCCYSNRYNCSTTFYLGCHCYNQSSSIYSKETCVNIGGRYADVKNLCYYDSDSCRGFWYLDQCFSVYSEFFNASTCPGVYDAVTDRCYIY